MCFCLYLGESTYSKIMLKTSKTFKKNTNADSKSFTLKSCREQFEYHKFIKRTRDEHALERVVLKITIKIIFDNFLFYFRKK